MIIQLPLTSDPAQDFVIQLGSVKYEFYVRYNDRGSFWSADISDYNSQTTLIAGMPLLLGCDLLAPFLLGNGSMIVYDEKGSNTDAGDPDSGDLGSRVNVYWYDSAEVTSILS
jgi:hypothetical protein